MNTRTSHEVRPLTDEELDRVTGSFDAVFYYGNLSVGIRRDGTVVATNGCINYEIRHN